MARSSHHARTDAVLVKPPTLTRTWVSISGSRDAVRKARPLRPWVAVVGAAAAAASLSACSRDPAETSRLFVESGDRYASAGNLNAAALEYGNAIKQTPSSTEAHQRLAAIAARQHDT